MTLRARFLTGESPTSPSPPAEDDSPGMNAIDSDFVVILAALLCALICVLGLVAVARCAWIRRLAGRYTGNSNSGPPLPTANKGLKKKVLRSLPRVTYPSQTPIRSSDCTICLSEFTTGDDLRLLPQCGHAFHVDCIDMWLSSHSTCPSCRKILVAARCEMCGELPTSCNAGDVSQIRSDHIDTFLP